MRWPTISIHSNAPRCSSQTMLSPTMSLASRTWFTVAVCMITKLDWICALSSVGASVVCTHHCHRERYRTNDPVGSCHLRNCTQNACDGGSGRSSGYPWREILPARPCQTRSGRRPEPGPGGSSDKQRALDGMQSPSAVARQRSRAGVLQDASRGRTKGQGCDFYGAGRGSVGTRVPSAKAVGQIKMYFTKQGDEEHDEQNGDRV